MPVEELIATPARFIRVERRDGPAEHDDKNPAPVFIKKIFNNNKLDRYGDSTKRHLALVFSAALHAALAGTILWQSPIPEFGADGRTLDAISIEIVEIAGGLAGAAQQAGTDRPPVPRSPMDRKDEDDEKTALPQALLAAPAREPAVQPTTAGPPPRLEERVAPSPAVATGVPQPPEPATHASAGELKQFAVAVRQAIGRAAPRAPGYSGQIEVAFHLTADGTVTESRVTVSSGLPFLDQAALQTIRRAKFPHAPPGLDDHDLSFRVPFVFRT